MTGEHASYLDNVSCFTCSTGGWFRFVCRPFWNIHVFLLIIFALLAIIFWLFDFSVRSSTGSLMVSPPRVSCRRSSVHCSFYIAKEWLAVLTRSVTAPPVLPVDVYFIMEGVINLNRVE